MSSNGSRSKKHSKDAQAERILQSLFYKSKSSVAPSSRKIKKKRRPVPENSFQLTFRTSQNQRRTLHWLLPHLGGSRARNGPALARASLKRQKDSGRAAEAKTVAGNNGTVNYADLFESAYQVIKSESSASRSRQQAQVSSDPKTENTVQTRSNDFFSGIEYDPVDNYFYLVSHQSSLKKPLFQNKGLFEPVTKPCLVINPRLVESLKKDFALESFLC